MRPGHLMGFAILVVLVGAAVAIVLLRGLEEPVAVPVVERAPALPSTTWTLDEAEADAERREVLHRHRETLARRARFRARDR